MIRRRVEVVTGCCVPNLVAAGWVRATMWFPSLLVLINLSMPGDSWAQDGGRSVNWSVYGGDPGGMRYSPLADVNRANVAGLVRLWSWETGERPIPDSDSAKAARPGTFQATPLVVNDTMYLSTPYNRVVALDAGTGRELWRYDPGSHRYGQPSNGTGFVHRGVALWTSGRERRVFINSRWRLIALDAATGRPIPGFGSGGEVDLTAGLDRPVNRLHYTNTSPPVVWGDLVIVGNGVGDRLMYRNDPPGDVQAFDARTGRRVWRFRTVPAPGEFGHDTWEGDSWRTTGHTNVWAPFTVDSARGLVYLPVGTPSNDWYGGTRKGANLFGESIVCLDARTGKRVWHFQVVHHGLWDYDLPAPPNVITIRRPGGVVDAVVVPTKQGFIFAFDRVTGQPLWPIQERAVPASDVPGESTWPTQPFPTLPAPVTPQGFSLADVIDFTPAIREAALAVASRYRVGPLYTPPSMQGTITLPGSIGGVGWGGAAYDPEANTLYVKASHSPSLWRIVKRDAPSDTVDVPYAPDLGNSGLGVRLGEQGPRLPINKPPYGTLTAIDMATGQFRWQVPVGDSPDVRSHPALAGVSLPPMLGVSGAPGGIVTRGGLVFLSGGGRTLYAVDTRDGAVRWSADLGQQAYANPMTYRTRTGTQFVVIATGSGAGASLQAFALPGVQRGGEPGRTEPTSLVGGRAGAAPPSHR
jgi:quinoprotein glucose dehydrogenase